MHRDIGSHASTAAIVGNFCQENANVLQENVVKESGHRSNAQTYRHTALAITAAQGAGGIRGPWFAPPSLENMSVNRSVW